jgi:transglutaminase-like putative cysteine protease
MKPSNPLRWFSFLLVMVLLGCTSSPASSPTLQVFVPASAVTPVPTHAFPTATFPAPTATSVPAPTGTVPPPPGAFTYTHPQKYQVDYNVAIHNLDFAMNDLRVYLPIPGEWEAQKDVHIVEILPQPAHQGVEATTGNAMLYWHPSGSALLQGDANFSLQFTFTAYETVTKIDPGAILPYRTDASEYQPYTWPEKYIESDDPEIIQLADEIAAGETNPYRLERKFYNYIIGHFYYKVLHQGLNGAKYLLKNSRGECGDYAALFVALSRAKGIPARPVAGYWAISGQDQTHVWAEFYLEGYGWIPVDPTAGQRNGAKLNYYFGNMDNQRVILSKGYNVPLTPEGPDGFVAPLLQVPLWWFKGDGNPNDVSMTRTWTVKKLP